MLTSNMDTSMGRRSSAFVCVLFIAMGLLMTIDSTDVQATPPSASTAKLSLSKLVDQPNFSAERAARYFVVHLKSAHRVLSTSDEQGGQSTALRYLVNHQSMEANRDELRMDYILSRSDQVYHREVAQRLSVDPQAMALMGTAANMNHVAHSTAHFRDLRIDAFVTAGVTGNAMRSGDEARWYQGDEGNEFVGSKGTINTILLINRPMTAGAQAKAAMVMVEAKTAALMELAIASKQSTHLATGTGTDQFIVASPLLENSETDKQVKVLSSASGHLKLGELIGTAVREATLEALRWQNALEPSATRSAVHALSRFGLSDERVISDSRQYLSEASHQRFSDNLSSVLLEPRVTASAYALAAVLDRFQYEGLPVSIINESVRDQAANVAVSICADTSRWHDFWQKFETSPVSEHQLMSASMQLFIHALTLGWQCKWQ